MSCFCKCFVFVDQPARAKKGKMQRCPLLTEIELGIQMEIYFVGRDLQKKSKLCLKKGFKTYMLRFNKELRCG